jgi:hypothetical protein
MSSRTGTKTGTAESPMAIHHLVTGGFTSKNIQTIDWEELFEVFQTNKNR